MQSGRAPLVVAFLVILLAGTPVADAASTCPANNLLATPTTDFTINGNGTVTHDQTGLMWKQCAEGLSGPGCDAGGAMSSATLMNWDAALSAAVAPFAGYSDWRLPNQKELESIVEAGCFSPSINEAAFPNTPAATFWSSTTSAQSQPNAWVVYFNYGAASSYNTYKTNSYYVRLVRLGQSFDFFDAKKKGQVIVFGTAPTIAVNGNGAVSATGGGSLNPVLFSSLGSSVCTVSGSVVTGLNAGSCTVAANQAGSTTYNAAAQVTQVIIIDKASQTIGFGTAPTIVVGGTGSISAIASSGLAVSKSSTTSGICSISGNTVTGITAGLCTITGDQHGNANFYAAPQASLSFTIGKASQVIGFGLAPALAVGGTNVVNATGGASGNAVTFSSQTLGVCAISDGNTVTGTAAGNCSIAADQMGNANYLAAPQVVQSFPVGKGNQTIVFGAAPAIAAGYTGTVTAAGGPSGNPVSFSSATSGVCTVAGSTVTGLTAAGTCMIAADQAGSVDYYPAPQVLQSLVLLDAAIRLNDTGQSNCFNGSALVACSAANSGDTSAYPRQDGRFGRDAAAAAGHLPKIGGGAAGFDFTRICMSGEMAGQGACPANPVPGTGANQWACTRDNVTHRIWSLDSPVHNWPSATSTYPAAMNTSNRCGYNTGWRLPTRRELFSIVHSGRSNPAIDTVYFPGTPIVSPPAMLSAYYWSADIYHPALTDAWTVDFEAGYTFAWAKTHYIYARLVRSGP